MRKGAVRSCWWWAGYISSCVAQWHVVSFAVRTYVCLLIILVLNAESLCFDLLVLLQPCLVELRGFSWAKYELSKNPEKTSAYKLFAYSFGHTPGSGLAFLFVLHSSPVPSSQLSAALCLSLLEKNHRCKSLKWHCWLPRSAPVAGTLSGIRLWVCSRSPNMKERSKSLNDTKKVLLWIPNAA